MHKLLSLVAILLPLALSCAREAVPPEPSSVGGEALLRLSLGSPDERDGSTKSILSGGQYFSGEKVNDVLYLLIGEDGSWRHVYVTAAGSGNDYPATLRVRAQTYGYTLYAFVNMGNVIGDIPRSGGVPVPADYRYPIGDFSSLSLKGMPMAGSVSVNASALGSYAAGAVPVTVPLRRLMARVSVSVDKGAMLTGAGSGAALSSATVRVRQAAKALYPFRDGGSAALSEADVYADGESADWYAFSATERDAMTLDPIEFFVPENRQGTVSGISSQAGKTASAAGAKGGLATYLEYSATKSGTQDGVSGDISYRVYLGEDNSSSFDVVGNRTYTATLSLTWDGMWEGTWRVVQGSNWNDGRTLRWLDESGADISYIRLSKKSSATAWAFFSTDGTTGTAGRKDIGVHPYGWSLSADGEVLSGSDGSSGGYTISTGLTAQCLGYESVGGKTAMRVVFSATKDAVVTYEREPAAHRLVLRTTDGRRSSATLEIDIASVPLVGEWDGDGPLHVGQRGVLRCIDPEIDPSSPSTGGAFHTTDEHILRVSDRGDGTAWVDLIAPGEASIYIDDGEGDRVSEYITLSPRVPWFGCTDLWTTYIDAAVNLRFTYYAAAADGSRTDDVLQVSPTAWSGPYLCQALVEELIAPAATSRNGRLGFARTLSSDGTYLLSTYVATYDSLEPSGAFFTVDEARLSMEGYNSSSATYYRGLHTTPFVAWNPWKNLSGDPVEGAIMNDYTLYRAPRQSSPYTGWEANPWSTPLFLAIVAPKETATYTMDIQNAVVASTGNLTFNAGLLDVYDRRVGNLCSGTPGKTAADFDPASWTLTMTVTSPSTYDRTRVYNYLYGRGFAFLDVTDMDQTLSQFDNVIVIGSSFSSESQAWASAPDNVSASSPSYIQGVTFSVTSNASLSTWTMTYGTAGKTLSTHGAGRVAIYMQVRNPHDGSLLERQIGKAYMRLHAYVWGQVHDWSPSSFTISPLWLVGDDPNLQNLPPVLHMKTSMTARVGGFGSATLPSSTYYASPSDNPHYSWSTPSGATGSADAFVEFIRSSDQPWYFDISSSTSPALSDPQRSDRYAAASEGYYSGGRLYYDPSGATGTFSKVGNAPYNTANTQKLYVIHLGYINTSVMNWAGNYNIGWYLEGGWH